jgi:copper(I)-binding protein
VSRSRRAFPPLGRLAVAATVAGLVAGITGCDAGNNAPTLQFHPQSEGIDTAAHGVLIRDAFVLGPQIGFTLQPGQSAGFFLALFNYGPRETLTSVTAPGTATSVKLPPGGVELFTQQPVYLTRPVPRIVLTGLTRPLTGGQTVRLTLNFQNTGSVTLTVPVLPRGYDYATFSPAPAPAPAATATVVPLKHGKHKHASTSATSPSATP